MCLVKKKILLGITGGIAVYKIAELVRLLIKNNCDVRVIMTKSAMEFVTPLTFQTLSNNKVYTTMFEENIAYDVEHISLAKWADHIIIAPATANIISKIANGLADDLLSTVCLAAYKKIIVVPAMNEGMWCNPATQNNIKALCFRNIKILGPADGFQACGDVGPGRMLEPLEILKLYKGIDSDEQLFCNKKIVITAGPTQESIDPVRYLTNRSSGKMGYAIAEVASKMGADVTLISGPVNLPVPENVNLVKIVSAIDMYNAVMNNIDGADIYISAAAVADYRPAIELEQKFKKSDGGWEIKLERNPDIISTVSSLRNKPFIVGFSAETENLIENAKGKLHRKKLDMIAANYVGQNTTFGKNESELVIIDKAGNSETCEIASKSELANKLLRSIYGRYCC